MYDKRLSPFRDAGVKMLDTRKKIIKNGLLIIYILLGLIYSFSCKTEIDNISSQNLPPDTLIKSGPEGDLKTDSMVFEAVIPGQETSTIKFIWTGSDDKDTPEMLLYSFRLNTTIWSPFKVIREKIYRDLSPGSHVFQVKAKDSEGLEDPTPAERMFTIQLKDKIPPETKIDSGPSDTIDGSKVEFTFSGNDDKTPSYRLLFSYKLDSQEWCMFSEGTKALFSDIEEGEHIFLVKAKDEAGNEDPTPAEWRFFVKFPLKPPVVILVGPPIGATVDLTVTFNWKIRNSNERIFRAEVCTDKGINPFDGWNEDTFDAGSGTTSLTVTLDPIRYGGQRFDWGVRIWDGKKYYKSAIWWLQVK